VKPSAGCYQEYLAGGALGRQESADRNVERGEGSQNSPLQDEDEQKEKKITKDFVESYDQSSSLPLLLSVKISLCSTESGALRRQHSPRVA
jgi:hypothetical protein